VKQQPGEAILDWPFCVTGGNGIGSLHGLCPYFGQNSGVFTFSKYHGKKVVGQYYGRLHPSQIEPFIQAGWYKLFAPGKGDSFTRKQSRCFYADEWLFFSDFYKYNDFAGINLYVDLLPESCVAKFYQHFGDPVAETEVPGVGRVQFIQKTLELRQQANTALGRSLKFHKIVDFDLIKNRNSELSYGLQHKLILMGLSNIKENKSKSQQKQLPWNLGSRWRWGLGSQTNIRFTLYEPQELNLILGFVNLSPEQDISININGISVKKIDRIKAGAQSQHTIQFLGIVGVNNISFNYSKPSEKNKIDTQSNSQPITVAFTDLRLSTTQSLTSH
ncbi:MAG TPA: hypothetical protein V6C95_15875, partial [Coleofasciculaceae cyanobacterium]